MVGPDPEQCREALRRAKEAAAAIGGGRFDPSPLYTHTYPLDRIAEAYELFGERMDGVLKVAVLGKRDSGLVSTLTMSGVTFENVDKLSRRYLDRIQELVEAPIAYVSVGTRRDQIIGVAS